MVETTTGASADPPQIYVCCSRNDREWLDSFGDVPLLKFLADSLRIRHARLWLDPDLRRGEDLAQQFAAEIKRSDIALLLVSQNFLNSSFIKTQEMPLIVERVENGQMAACPLILTPCDWLDDQFLTERQAIPPKPLIEYGRSREEWSGVCYEILDNLTQLIGWRRQSGHSSKLAEPSRPEAAVLHKTATDGTVASSLNQPSIKAADEFLPDYTRIPAPIENSNGNRRVFLSAKSEDYAEARRVYDFLTQKGFDVFFSDESLPRLGNSDYRDEIDRALDEAEHMVVVTTSKANVESAWVKAEWGFFINEKRANRKHGNLLTVVSGGLAAGGLPPSLRYYEVVDASPSGLERLIRYL